MTDRLAQATGQGGASSGTALSAVNDVRYPVHGYWCTHHPFVDASVPNVARIYDYLLGGCDQPASACEVHHVTHQACGGKTSVHDCQLYCFFHYHVAIHQMGWTVVRNPDGTTVAFSPDGTKVLRSHSPPPRPG
jgi:hypothetical protein